MPRYTPAKGDFIYLSFDPQAGHEQKGRRPALVISNDAFNRRTGLTIVCPVTTTDRKIPFHPPVPEGLELTGFVMVEQVKSIDYAARRATRIERAPAALLDDVLSVLEALIR